MKVLMYGWEFPPHISGGLGTACYGLTKGLTKIPEMEILFVIPKTFGDEDINGINLIGASEFTCGGFTSELNNPVLSETAKGLLSKLQLLEIKSFLHPYFSEDEFDNFIKSKNIDKEDLQITANRKIYYKKNGKTIELNLDEINSNIKISGNDFQFTGKYGSNLMTEVSNFAKISSFLCKKHDFDIIHAHDWLTYPAGIVAKQNTGKPLVIHVHATEFDRVSEQHINPNVYETEKAGMEYADKIITVSNLTKQRIINHYGSRFSKKSQRFTTALKQVPMKIDNTAKTEIIKL